MSRLFRKTLALMIVLFGIIATGTSVVSAWNLYHQLTQEYRSKGAAIARSIADSSVEILLDRDPATVQAVVDQFAAIEGVAYVFVADRSGDILLILLFPVCRTKFSRSVVGRLRQEPMTWFHLIFTCCV